MQKLFRAACSMTPTFSTVVNFGMLGLLRRLHRMHIQSCLEAESVTTGIHFPRVDKHKQKDGHNSPRCCTSCLQDGKIEELVKKAEEGARKALLDLGIVQCKCEEDSLEDLFSPAEEDEEEVDIDNAQADVPVKVDLMEEVMQEDEEAVSSGISSLTNTGMVDAGLSKALTSLHRQTFRRVAWSALPVYEEQHTVNTEQATKRKCQNPFVELSYKWKIMHIHKTTVVWLFQEGERVSADRLFWVRGDQPCSSKQLDTIACRDPHIPEVYSTVHTGEICLLQTQSRDGK